MSDFPNMRQNMYKASQMLKTDDIESMKYLLKDDIGEGVLEDINDGLNLFKVMDHHGWLLSSKLDSLYDLFKEIERSDIVVVLKQGSSSIKAEGAVEIYTNGNSVNTTQICPSSSTVVTTGYPSVDLKTQTCPSPIKAELCGVSSTNGNSVAQTCHKKRKHTDNADDCDNKDNDNKKYVCAIVKYHHTAKAPNELTIHVCDTIKNIKKVDDGWSEGELNGKCGIFPTSYVTIKAASTSDTCSDALQSPKKSKWPSYPCSDASQSPKKTKWERSSKEYKGYIDGLTPYSTSKSGKWQYFKFSLLCKRKSYGVVCFSDSSRYDDISKIEKSNEGCILNNVWKNDEGDLKLTAKTEINTTALLFDKILKPTDISTVKNQCRINERVHIRGILYNLYDLPDVIKDGKTLKLKKGILQDGSGWIKIAIFNEEEICVIENMPYMLTYLTVGEYRNSKEVNTTPSTKISECSLDDLDDVISKRYLNVGLQRYTATIDEVPEECYEKFFCPNCPTNEISIKCGRGKCNKCKTVMTEKRCIRKCDFDLTLTVVSSKEKDSTKKVKCAFDLLNSSFEETLSKDNLEVLIEKMVDISFDNDDKRVIDIRPSTLLYGEHLKVNVM